MSTLMQNILVGVAGFIVTIAVIVALAAHFKFFKLKARIQEDLANTYTPEILGIIPEKKEVDKDDSKKAKESS